MELFFSALVLGYSGAMMPGPLLTYCIERSLCRGWKAGLLVPLGHVLLELLIVALLTFGLGSFLDKPVPKSIVLFTGGAVLLWFGLGMVRGAARNTLAVPGSGQPLKRGADAEIILKSGVISAVNPYFILWWATIGLGMLLSSAKLGVWGLVLFYAGHATADFSWYFAVSLLCDRISRFLRGKAYRVVIAVLGAALGFFAVKFIVDGVLLLRVLG